MADRRIARRPLRSLELGRTFDRALLGLLREAPCGVLGGDLFTGLDAPFLLGLDRGEFASIPSLQDGTLFDAYETARQAMIGKLSTATPAPRYRAAA